MTHALIVGSVGVGKSTLINRVLRELNAETGGFETRKEESLRTEDRGFPVYIHTVGEQRHFSDKNLLGWRGGPIKTVFTDTFDRYARRIDAISGCDVIKMDELGFMEADSAPFCQAVMRRLDGDIPVIAAVKPMDIPFLNAVRSHPHARVFVITEENRDALFFLVLEYMRQSLGHSSRHKTPPQAKHT